VYFFTVAAICLNFEIKTVEKLHQKKAKIPKLIKIKVSYYLIIHTALIFDINQWQFMTFSTRSNGT